MAVTSVAPALRAAVIGGLETHFTGLDDFNGTTARESRTEVRHGWSADWQAAEKVYLGRARATTPPAGMRPGRNLRNESGSFEINVSANLPGQDIEAAEARAWAIAGEIDDWLSLRKNNELAVTGLQTLAVTGWEADCGSSDSGSGAVVTLTVSWTARLDA